MDIKEEREAFEKWAFQASGGWASFSKSHGEIYANDKLQFAWEAWKAAKVQVVLEGFVLMPRDPSLQLLQAGKSYLPSDCLCSDLEKAYLAMIEAQEQSHD